MVLYTFHLFAGAGGGILADLLLGHRPIGAVEIEQYPRDVLLRHQLTGELPNFPVWDDVRSFSIDNDATRPFIERLRGIREQLCISGGFPCFAKGTFILTADGYKPIENVVVGDSVLTHRGRWRRVTSVMQKNSAEIWTVKGFGILKTETTGNHRYFVRRGESYEWQPVQDIRIGDYSTIPMPDVEDDEHSPEWWKLVGRYLADGWRVKRLDRNTDGGRIVIACCDQNTARLRKLSTTLDTISVLSEKEPVGSSTSQTLDCTESLNSSDNTPTERRLTEKRCACQRIRQERFLKVICQATVASGKTERPEPQRQQAPRLLLVSLLSQSDLERTSEFTNAIPPENAESKTEPVIAEISTRLFSITMVGKVSRTRSTSITESEKSKSLIDLIRFITCRLRKMNPTLQTEQSFTTVRTFPLLEKVKESAAKGQDFGANLPELFAKFDQSTCSWKTPTCLLDEDLTLYSLTLPKWGILWRGELFPLPTSARPICVNGSGDLRFPTACATGKGGTGAWKKWQEINQRERERVISNSNGAREQGSSNRKDNEKEQFRPDELRCGLPDAGNKNNGRLYGEQEESDGESKLELRRETFDVRRKRREIESRLGGMVNGISDWLDDCRNGTLWTPDEKGLARIAVDIPNRAARLKAIGNGQVPLCAAVAFETLKDILESYDC